MEHESYVHVRCKVREGAFPTEYLIILETGPENHAGFVPCEYVDIVNADTGVIEGRIIEADDNFVTVQFPGSFFHTSIGIFSFPKDWADDNMTPAELAKKTA